MKNFQFILGFLFIAYCLLFIPLSISAATFAVEVDTGIETINALEAVVHIPRDASVEKIYDGNSAILLWVKAPTFDEKIQTLSFSGITPGGFRGRRIILSFSGAWTKADLPYFTFSDVSALKNDGLGTVIPIKLILVPTEIVEDQVFPEPFNLIISTSPEVFDGQYFLSFATQDKGTGVAHYEYVSTWLLPPGDDDWLETKSPMVLSREMLFQMVHVRAVDSAGNYRVSSIAGPYHYTILFLGIIILLCVLLCLRHLVSQCYLFFSWRL